MRQSLDAATLGVLVHAGEVVDGQRARLTVRDVEHRRERERAGVGRGRLRKVERETRDDGCLAHFFSGFDIGSVGNHSGQVVEDEVQRMHRAGIADRLVAGAPVAFDRVAEDIKAGSGGDLRGDGDGQFGVDQRIGCVEVRAADRGFLAELRIGEHCDTGDFAAGSSGGRHADQRQMGLGKRDAGTVVSADVRACGKRAERCRSLRAVHGGSAAQRKYKFSFHVTQKIRAGVDIENGGIRLDLGENRDQFSLRVFDDPVGKAAFCEEGVCDEDAVFQTIFIQDLGDAFHRAGFEDDLGRL